MARQQKNSRSKKSENRNKRKNRSSERKNNNKSEKNDSDSECNRFSNMNYEIANEFGFNLGPIADSINY